MTSTIIKTDGSYNDVEPRNKVYFQADEIHDAVGGYFETLYLSKSQVMFVNEEGKLQNLPVNMAATIGCRMAGINDIIVGDVLVCDINMVR